VIIMLSYFAYQRGKNSLGVWIVLLVVAIAFTTFAQEQPQSPAQSKLNKGIEMFYMAQFESAIRFLREALLDGTLSNSEQFDAYVYIGFSLIRQNENQELVDKSFIEAIKAAPQKTLSPLKVPPDLLTRFQSVKANMRGDIVVESDPADAVVLLVNPDYDVEMAEIAPAVFDNLLVGQYGLLVSKEQYQQKIFKVINNPGMVDTIRVTLEKKSQPFYKRWWAWGSGLAIATAIAIATSGREEDKPPETSDLPAPPERP